MIINHEKKLKFYFMKKIREKDYLISVLEDNKKYLVSGTYRVSWTGKRKVYLKNKNTAHFLLKNKLQSNNSFLFKMKSVIDAISASLSTITITNEKEQKLEGELVMMTYSSNVKIIDFTKKIILNRMEAAPLTYERVKQGYQSLNKHFKMTIIEFLDEEFIYYEKYLEFIPYNLWEARDIKDCINEIFNSYIRYFVTIKKGDIPTHNPAALFEEIKATDYKNHKTIIAVEEWLEESPEELLYPIIRGHGDMKFENILLAEKEFYFIDLEFSAAYFFIYDLINLIFNEAMNGDFSYVQAFLEGAYDEKYKKLFEAMGLVYDNKKKLYYIAVYLVDRIIHYDLKVVVHRLDLTDMFNKYFMIMTKIEELDKQV